MILVISLSSPVDVLLEEIEFFIAEDAVLLSVLPLKIAGKKVTKDDFKPYQKYSYYLVDLIAHLLM